MISVAVPVNALRIKMSLHYVHYWEDRARGLERRSRTEAYCETRNNLNRAERQILRNTLLIQDHEIQPDKDGVL